MRASQLPMSGINSPKACRSPLDEEWLVESVRLHDGTLASAELRHARGAEASLVSPRVVWRMCSGRRRSGDAAASW